MLCRSGIYKNICLWTKFSFSQENFPKFVCVYKCVCVLAFVFCSGGSRLRWSASSSGHDLTHWLAQLPASPLEKAQPRKTPSGNMIQIEKAKPRKATQGNMIQIP